MLKISNKKKQTNHFIKFENIQIDLMVSDFLFDSKIGVPIDRESGFRIDRKVTLML